MDSSAIFLISILHDNSIVKCVLKIDRNNLSGDCEEHPMEHENREFLYQQLPEYVREWGPIIGVDMGIFDVIVVG